MKRLFIVGFLSLSSMISIISSVIAKPLNVALIINVDGPAANIVSSYNEVLDGTIIPLEDSIIKFVDYKTCSEVTIKGGSVTFNSNGYVTTSNLVNVNKQACPTRVQLNSTTSVTAGVLLRGKIEPITLPMFNNIVLDTKTSVKSILFKDDETEKTYEYYIKSNAFYNTLQNVYSANMLITYENGKTASFPVVFSKEQSLTIINLDNK